MITTVTLNAAIDKTYYMDNFLLHKVNRMRNMHAVPGGKGINVAKVLHTLGLPVMATGIVGGKNGEYIEKELLSQQIANDFVHTESGESRLCLNIISHATGGSTEILEPGPTATTRDLALVKRKVSELADKSDIVVFSGSLLQGAPVDMYAQLIQIAQASGAMAFLDTSGMPLLSGVQVNPFFVKPNEDEIKVLLQDDNLSESNLLNAIGTLMNHGIACVVVTLGSSGSIAGFQGECYRVHSPAVEAINPVGCGDTFVAGMAAGFLQRWPFVQILQYASAAAAANACSEQAGQVDINIMQQLLPKVLINKL